MDTPQQCPSPCVGTSRAAVDAGTSPHVHAADVSADVDDVLAMSPSLMVPTGEHSLLNHGFSEYYSTLHGPSSASGIDVQVLV